MQTWILMALLVLSLFANGYLIAQRAAPSTTPPPDAALVSDLQRMMDGLEAEPEWRHRLVSLGRFAAVREERRRSEQQLLAGEMFEMLSRAAPDIDAVNTLLEQMGLEDATHRARLLGQLTILLNDLDPQQRMIMLERFRLLELHLDDLETLGQLTP
jgi:Spy/CpxP family protein refolding chaperone